MKTYKSRVSILLVVFVALVCFLPPVVFAKEPKISGDIVCFAVFCFFLFALNSIKYVIDGETLKVYYFYGIHDDIDIKRIKKMEPSRCILTSPAASLDRLAVYYGRFDVVYISPRNQDDFIKQINEIRGVIIHTEINK